MARATQKTLDQKLDYVSGLIGRRIDFHAHNSRGYGVLYLPEPGSTGVTNVVGGSSTDGLDKRTAVAVLDAVATLIERGYVVPAGKE